MHDSTPIPKPIHRKCSQYDPNKHHRRSIRLMGYDYSQPGFYFVTICTHQRQLLFGDVVDGMMVLNDLGEIVANEWVKTPTIRPNVKLDEWIIMPDHIHGIIAITDIAQPAGAYCGGNKHYFDRHPKQSVPSYGDLKSG